MIGLYMALVVAAAGPGPEGPPRPAAQVSPQDPADAALAPRDPVDAAGGDAPRKDPHDLEPVDDQDDLEGPPAPPPHPEGAAEAEGRGDADGVDDEAAWDDEDEETWEERRRRRVRRRHAQRRARQREADERRRAREAQRVPNDYKLWSRLLWVLGPVAAFTLASVVLMGPGATVLILSGLYGGFGLQILMFLGVVLPVLAALVFSVPLTLFWLVQYLFDDVTPRVTAGAAFGSIVGIVAALVLLGGSAAVGGLPLLGVQPLSNIVAPGPLIAFVLVALGVGVVGFHVAGLAWGVSTATGASIGAAWTETATTPPGAEPAPAHDGQVPGAEPAPAHDGQVKDAPGRASSLTEAVALPLAGGAVVSSIGAFSVAAYQTRNDAWFWAWAAVAAPWLAVVGTTVAAAVWFGVRMVQHPDDPVYPFALVGVLAAGALAAGTLLVGAPGYSWMATMLSRGDRGPPALWSVGLMAGLAVPGVVWGVTGGVLPAACVTVADRVGLVE